MMKSLDKLVSGKNNSNKPAFKRNNGNNKVDKYSINSNSIEHTKKLGKLKSQKLFKSSKSKNKNWLSLKNCSKVEIYLNLILKGLNQVF